MFRRRLKKARDVNLSKKPRRLAFERNLVHPKKRAELIDFLRLKLRNGAKFFRGLEKIYNNDFVRRFDFKGTPVVIKDTEGLTLDGYKFKVLRQTFLAHQKAVRNGLLKAEHYKLKSPKVYEQIGNYLIMEYIEDIGAEVCKSRDYTKHTSFTEASSELEKNFRELRRRGLIKKEPQMHLMTVGTSDHLRGKWVLFLPYDYT